jgi:cyanophycinase-like exopeptidase
LKNRVLKPTMKLWKNIMAGMLLAVFTADAAPVVGPTNGTLVICGGGLKDNAILQRFIELAGGSSAPIVLIPTANENDQFGPDWTYYKSLHDWGATNLMILHTRHRTNDLVAVVKRFSNLLGIGLDENTTIVVHGDNFEVLGASKVAIYDPKRAPVTAEKPYYFLQAGERFNLCSRQTEAPVAANP